MTSSLSRRHPLLFLPLLLLLAGCGTTKGLLIRMVMDKATPLPAQQIERDLVYGPEGAADPRQELDLFRPGGRGWPLLIFVHGGSWSSGDKALEIGSFDPYQNIGRFYATRGVGVAVLNYRLQPQVTWREQVKDVAMAVGWLAAHVKERGGDPNRIFLIGHSAGSQLISYVALAPWLEPYLAGAKICGVVPVSGAGFDLADAKTYELGALPAFYEKTFRAGQADGVWQKEASAITYVRTGLPPFLFFYGKKEWPSLAHQNQLFLAALRQAGVEAELEVIPKLSHSRMALAISDEKKPLPEAILRFVGSQSCED
jgi:acetyl esterase/lipase